MSRIEDALLAAARQTTTKVGVVDGDRCLTFDEGRRGAVGLAYLVGLSPAIERWLGRRLQ